LKELNQNKVWILHWIDAATRYSAAQLRTTRGKDVVVNDIFYMWTRYNGIVMRRNRVLFETMMKMMDETKCKPSLTLAWACSAKNALSNQNGYSPNQLAGNVGKCRDNLWGGTLTLNPNTN
jgi:hypothetical protein